MTFHNIDHYFIAFCVIIAQWIRLDRESMVEDLYETSAILELNISGKLGPEQTIS